MRPPIGVEGRPGEIGYQTCRLTERELNELVRDRAGSHGDQAAGLVAVALLRACAMHHRPDTAQGGFDSLAGVEVTLNEFDVLLRWRGMTACHACGMAPVPKPRNHEPPEGAGAARYQHRRVHDRFPSDWLTPDRCPADR